MSVLSRGQIDKYNVEWFEKILIIDHFRVPKTFFFHNEAKGKTFVVKMSFICMRIKNVFASMASHVASLWNRGSGKLENGLLTIWRQIRRILVVDNSPIIFRIVICFAIPFLQSNTSLKAKNTKQVSGTFLEGKSSFWKAKIQEIKV